MPEFRPTSQQWLFSAVCLSLSVLQGCSSDPPTAPRQADGKLVPVRTVSVVQEDVRRTTTQPATVVAYYRTEVRARISGYVTDVAADIGDIVEKGKVLAVIAVPEVEKQRQVIEARIASRESEEQQAEARIQSAEANVRFAEAKLAQARSELNKAEASLAAMESEFNRTRDLVQRQSLESRLLDEVRKKRDSEQANKQAMTAAINSAEAEVIVAQAKLAAARADLQAAKAETEITRRELDEVDVLLAYATLKAPFTGLVTVRTVDPGNLVREGNEVGRGQPLFVISQVDKVRVHIPVPEADAALVSQGDAITLRFPSFPAEQPIEVTVTRLSGELDPSTRTMLVEAEVENSGNKILPGMFGEASIALNTKVAANMLPARAIRFSESGDSYVYVVAENDTVTQTPVTLGIDNGHSIEVTSGVMPGQRVIDAHLKRFQTGQQVALLPN